MTHIKTAVSLDQVLFKQAEVLAEEMHISRSRLFVLALEDFIRHYENRQLLAQIDRAYADTPDADEQKQVSGMRRLHRQAVEGGW